MTSSTLLRESCCRTGYSMMPIADLDQSFGLNPLEPFDQSLDFIVDTDNLDLLKLVYEDSSLDFDFATPSYGRHAFFDPFFDILNTAEPFLYPTEGATDPSPSPPPPTCSAPPPTNPLLNQVPSGLFPPSQDSCVERRDEYPYRNIPTVVQDSLSEYEGEEEEDNEHAASAAAAAETGHGQRPELNASMHNFDKIPRTVCGSAKTPTTAPRRVRRRKDQLWYFLLETLGNPKYNPHYIQWENKDLGIFRFIESKKVAQLWGAKKNRSNMSYEYFARAMRHYYSRGIMQRVAGRRLVYQFGPKAENWKNYAQLVAISAATSSSTSSSSSYSASPNTNCITNIRSSSSSNSSSSSRS